jgi:hypothetical protein
LVEAEVAADSGERLGVFAEAFGLELLARETVAGQVAVAVVDAADPALVLQELVLR